MASIKFLQDIYVDGAIGIGTSTPSHNLEVVSSGNVEALFNRTGGAELKLRSQSNLGYIGTDSNHPLNFGTNGGIRVSILTNGLVGIGTSSPSAKLEVYDGDIKLNDGTRDLIIGEEGSLSYKIDSSGYLIIDATSGIQINKYTTQNVSINNGSLGIGTTSPSNILNVDSGVASDIAKFENNNGYMILGYTSGLGSLDLAASQKFRIRQGSQTPFYIASSGAVQLSSYGSGSQTGTAAYTLAVDSSGNIIETTGGGGGGGTGTLQQVTDAGNTTTNSITLGSSTAGSARLNVVGADSTDANDALLIENSSGDDLFKITNSGNIFIEHATRTNAIVINNVDNTGTGTYSTILGWEAADGSNVNATYATALGARAMDNCNGGSFSVAIGMNAARSNQSASSAVVIGNNAAASGQGVNGSVAIGRSAGQSSNHNFSVVIGYYAGKSLGSTQRSNNVYIGANTATSSNNANGNTFIGANLQTSSTEGLSDTVIIGSNNAERLRVDSTGKFKFDSYGSGSFTGTATVNLEADSSGNVIERLEERGTFSGTTDSITGQLTISHSLGETPSFVMLTMDDYSNQATYSSVVSKTSTTVTIVNPNRGATVSGYYIFSN